MSVRSSTVIGLSVIGPQQHPVLAAAGCGMLGAGVAQVCPPFWYSDGDRYVLPTVLGAGGTGTGLPQLLVAIAGAGAAGTALMFASSG